jgi:hypothetical protein
VYVGAGVASFAVLASSTQSPSLLPELLAAQKGWLCEGWSRGRGGLSSRAGGRGGGVQGGGVKEWVDGPHLLHTHLLPRRCSS